ncbi:MAG: aminodeoxychorismate lyase [Gammaproteobacteria bacterium]|jgi:4-amino-4-deoxychorismate lyase
MAKFLLNGQPGEALPLTDRAIHYGDGVFESIAVVDGALLCWEEHLRRLHHGCTRLAIPPPAAETLRAEADSLLPARGRAVLKIIVSRGQGGRGYQSPESVTPTRLLGLYDWPDYPETLYRNGVTCTLSRVRLGHVPALAGIKHLNRLEQVLARDDVTARGFREGLVLDLDGNVIEGTMSNLFLIKDTTLITPDVDKCGVAGIIRHLILERVLEWGLKPQVRLLSVDDVRSAEELFLCNSILGIWPITGLENQAWTVGPYTRAIMDSLTGDGQIAGP